MLGQTPEVGSSEALWWANFPVAIAVAQIYFEKIMEVVAGSGVSIQNGAHDKV